MKIFERLEEHDYEQLIFCHHGGTGLKAIICIHDTTLGPALGGLRIWDYKSEEEAIIDVLRLARGMTYKNAAAGLNFGGGKAVIMGDPTKIKSKGLFYAFAGYVNRLGGRYITAEDMNTSTEDIALIHEVTEFVVGVQEKSGNPSPVTAYGVYRGILAAANEVYGSPNLSGRTVAVQGLGMVGFDVCQYLSDAGAKLCVTDLDQAKIAKAADAFAAVPVSPEDIYSIDCDIFAPCAMGAVVNANTIGGFKCKIIAGSANNQLAESHYGDVLKDQGILYIPDYVINSGGVINVSEETQGYNKENAMAKAGTIYDSVSKIIALAKKDQVSTNTAADRLAEARIAAAKSKVTLQ